MRELLRHAAQLGVSVHTAHLPRPYRGYYDIERSVVVYDLGLTRNEGRSVLAHELGHAYYGHACEDDPKLEAQADAYAAMLLIDPDEYAELEQYSDHDHDLAEGLGVTEEIVAAFRRDCMTRLRGVTYVRPRHGIGQWAYRAFRVAIA